MAKEKNSLVGNWHITEMGEWDEDYFNMEVQAYITIDKIGTGDFQFGLVNGDIDGKFKKDRLDFSFEAVDEMDVVNGRGWLELVDDRTIKGEFYIHKGDSSTFTAERA